MAYLPGMRRGGWWLVMGGSGAVAYALLVHGPEAPRKAVPVLPATLEDEGPVSPREKLPIPMPAPRPEGFALPPEAARAQPPPAAGSARAADESEKKALAAVVNSGKTNERWASAFQRDMADWEALALRNLKGVSMAPWQCYKGGCLAEATYDDMEAMRSLDQAIVDSEPFANWPGGKMRTAPAIGERQVKATWVFLRPESPP